MHQLRLAVLFDLLEENWPSMDLVAEMLLKLLRTEHDSEVRAERICPRMPRRFSRVPLLGKQSKAFNIDRFLGRYWDYPRGLPKRPGAFDFYHICDHSYAHLVHFLPCERVGVYCHDLDAFRCLFDPGRERRSGWFRQMARRILHGLQKASVVFYSTSEVRRQIEEYGILDPRRLVHAPYGIAPEFTADLVEPDPAASTDSVVPGPFLLHVGSCIPRKRIDVLLDVFAGLTTEFPELRLVQVGGRWTDAQREQMTKLRITSAVTQWRGLDRLALAVLYRRASFVLQPSESEGFGLPVVEALACGAIVVASDIPVLREVGGEAGIYCPLGEPKAWVETIAGLLKNSYLAPPRKRRLAHAQRFSWKTHTRTILEAYKGLR